MHPTRIFKTPDELQKAFEEYKEHLEVESGKWLKVQYVGKGGDRKEDKYKLPMTMDGFEVFCHKNYGGVKQYFDNKDNLYNDFVTIATRIRTEIRDNQLTGAMLGVYNQQIAAKLNGLIDKQQIEIKEQMLFPDVP